MMAKEILFAKHYIVHLNGSKAAKEAGYSERSAHTLANRLLNKVEVQNYIQELMSERNKRVQISADDVLRELIKVAFTSVDDFYDDLGLKKLSELDEKAKAALVSYQVKSIKVGKDEDGNDEYEDVPIMKVHDKMKSLEMLGKYLGMFDKKPEAPEGGAKSQKKRVIIARRSSK